MSTKLIPASNARWMMRIESSWSVLPQAPNIIVPRHSFETWTPVRPSGRYSMVVSWGCRRGSGGVAVGVLANGAERGGLRPPGSRGRRPRG